MRKYNIYKWYIRSQWLSGTYSVDTVYIDLPDMEHAKQFIRTYVERNFPITDVRLSVATELVRVISPNETLPYAYYVNNEDAWTLYDVKDYYPEIVEYWNSKGILDIRIEPCGPVDEDCLYLNGEWFSYCRHPHEWMQSEDLCEHIKPTIRQRRNCTI